MKAFSLIELIIVFAIIGIITAISLSSFASYNSFQQFKTNTAEFSNFLNVSRSKAISQFKPAVCGTATLEGYKVAVTVDSTSYEQDVLCGGSSYMLIRKNLSSSLKFANGSASNIVFEVSSGTVLSPGTIVITGFGYTKTIVVDKIGNISMNNGLIISALPSAVWLTPIMQGEIKNYFTDSDFQHIKKDSRYSGNSVWIEC